MAKLSLLFLGATHIPGIGKATIVAMGATVYAVLTLIPGWLLASSLMTEYSLLKLLALVGLVAVSIIGVSGLLCHVAVKPQAKA
jgi:hypothetical protein